MLSLMKSSTWILCPSIAVLEYYTVVVGGWVSCGDDLLVLSLLEGDRVTSMAAIRELAIWKGVIRCLAMKPHITINGGSLSTCPAWSRYRFSPPSWSRFFLYCDVNAESMREGSLVLYSSRLARVSTHSLVL